MKSEPIEIFATILQLSVFMGIIYIMSHTLFGEGIIHELESYVAANFGM